MSITDDDAAIAAMVHGAHLPPLLGALAHATGDLSILRDHLRIDPLRAREPHAGMSHEQRVEARQLAVEVIIRLRDEPSAFSDHTLDAESLRTIMCFVLGEDVSDDYLPLLVEELGTDGQDLRAPAWSLPEMAPDRDFQVVIVGAGMSGLLVGHRLAQAGVPFVIFEKNDDVGGTWLENRYPGCRVDVPNHLYSYSFAQRRDWPQRFSTQSVLLDYFRDCARDWGVLPHIRFSAEVVQAAFDDDTKQWMVTLDSGEQMTANVVVSAVGQLNRPRRPDISGAFAGPTFHSATWDDSVDLSGKTVAVVGTGASGFQLIPEIADAAGRLLVFQRTPNWLMPTPDYHAPMPDDMQWLFTHVPLYSEWYRFWLFWLLAEGALAAARLDPSWTGHPGSVSELNDFVRVMLTDYLHVQFGDRPDLMPHVVPSYPPFAKRILLDNGVWGATLKRDDVDLITGSIERLEDDTIVMADGTRHAVDVVIFATGFEAARFLVPMKVTGRGGVDLHDHWDGNARAYLGITVPGFPNFFCLYGPNTNLVANGSIIFFSECEANYILGAVHQLLEDGSSALDCRPSVWEEFNVSVDAANKQMAWGASTVNSWYKNADGRVTQNWPFSLLEFWQRTRAPDLADFEVL